MRKIQRGLKVATMLLSLLTVGVLASSVQAQGSGCSTCSGGAPAEVVYSQPTPAYSEPVYSQPVYTAPATSSCGCKSSCGRKSSCGCKSCRKKKACPQCDCQYCELDVKKGEVEKSSYKVEQKEVCVPAVRLPWKKNCPPKRSRVRTVNVLKKHKYKCPQCQYKWSVHEPEDFEEPEAAEPEEAAEKTEEKAPETNGHGLTPEELKEFDLAPGEEIISVFSDPAEALGDVPRPPAE